MGANYMKTSIKVSKDRLVEVKEEAVEEKLAYMGYFVLLSNSRMTSAQVLSHYRDKDQVEKAFMNLKDRLNMRRLRMSSERGLEGKLFVQYLALILVSELKHRMEQANLFKDYTLDEVLEAFNRVEYFIHPSFGMTIGEILQKPEKLYEQLNLKNPASLGVRDFR
ncbi:IS1634 family transposase [Fundicoccus ignavus]